MSGCHVTPSVEYTMARKSPGAAGGSATLWNAAVSMEIGTAGVEVSGMLSTADDATETADAGTDDAAGDAIAAGAEVAADEASCANATGKKLKSHDVAEDDADDGAGAGGGAADVDDAGAADGGGAAGVAGVVVVAVETGAAADVVVVFIVDACVVVACASVAGVVVAVTAVFVAGTPIGTFAVGVVVPGETVDDGAMSAALDDETPEAVSVEDDAVPEAEPAAAAPAPPSPPPTSAACGTATYHESTSVADWNCFAARAAISVCPEKFPQNICAVPVEKTAELSGVNAEPGDPGGTRGAPSAFCTLSHDPRHEDG